MHCKTRKVDVFTPVCTSICGIISADYPIYVPYCRPRSEVSKGYVFTNVGHSVTEHGGGGGGRRLATLVVNHLPPWVEGINRYPHIGPNPEKNTAFILERRDLSIILESIILTFVRHLEHRKNV